MVVIPPCGYCRAGPALARPAKTTAPDATLSSAERSGTITTYAGCPGQWRPAKPFLICRCARPAWRRTMRNTPRSLLLRYGSAVVSVALATWVRLLLDPVLG